MPCGRSAPTCRTTVCGRSIHNVVLLALFLLAQRPAVQRRAIVYTTAESTSFRLTPADTLMFKPSEPTSEGKVYVFVDPRKTFQPMIGIGGALTDEIGRASCRGRV